MKAAFIERYGGPEVFQYGDFPDPIVGPGEIVVDVVATSVNAADWKVRLGEHKHTKLRLIPGRDFPARSALQAKASRISRWAIPCLVSAKPARRAPTRRRL